MQPKDLTDPPGMKDAIAKLVEPFRGFMVARGTQTEPIDQLTSLAKLAYERGAADAKQASEGIQRDVRERADSYTASFCLTLAASTGHPGAEPQIPRAAELMLRALFVNALLEARETRHVVDWSNPDQVELYTLAVEAESKRYEEINMKIAAAEKAVREPHPPADSRIDLDVRPNPFKDMALAAIPNWFDEMHAGHVEGGDTTRAYYAASHDPLFTAALNRAFAIGVLSVTQEHPEPTE